MNSSIIPVIYLAHHGLPASPSSKITIWSLIVMDGPLTGLMYTLNIAASAPSRPTPDHLYHLSPTPSYGLARPLRIDFARAPANAPGATLRDLVVVAPLPHGAFPCRSGNFGHDDDDIATGTFHYDLAPTHVFLGAIALGRSRALQTEQGRNRFLSVLADALVGPSSGSTVLSSANMNKAYLITQEWIVRAVNRLNLVFEFGLPVWMARYDWVERLDRERSPRVSAV